MADNKPEQEPSIEEILASIRQIISDDEPAATDTPPPAEPEPAEPEEDVLELTQNMQETPQEPETIEEETEPDLDQDFDIALAELNETLSAPEPVIETEEKEEPPMVAAAPPADEEEILSQKAEAAAIASMAKLAAGMPISKPGETPRHYDGVTLEDIVRDLLNPMLKSWMDQNLPPMVERLVQKELEKLARKALDR